MPRVFVVPDKFKGTLSSEGVCAAVRCGLSGSAFSVTSSPLADGGDGFLAALAPSLTVHTVTCTGPLLDRVQVPIGLSAGSVAYIEMAKVCGLVMVPEGKRNPLLTTTYGVGEAIRAAVGLGAETVVLGVGGSATSDGGIGCAQALGLGIVLEGGEVPTGPLVGGDMVKVTKVTSLAGGLGSLKLIRVACDVTTPFSDAVAVFSGQKGADGPAKEVLQAGMERLRSVWKTCVPGCGDVWSAPGTGAAGGIAGSLLVAFSGTPVRVELVSGAELIADALNVKAQIEACDLVVTGEGSLDLQTEAEGKGPGHIIDLAVRANKPVLAICGRAELGPRLRGLVESGKLEVLDLVSRFPIQQCKQDTKNCIEAAIKEWASKKRSLFCFFFFFFFFFFF
jgi:glycerate kinase